MQGKTGNNLDNGELLKICWYSVNNNELDFDCFSTKVKRLATENYLKFRLRRQQKSRIYLLQDTCYLINGILS